MNTKTVNFNLSKEILFDNLKTDNIMLVVAEMYQDFIDGHNEHEAYKKELCVIKDFPENKYVGKVNLLTKNLKLCLGGDFDSIEFLLEPKELNRTQFSIKGFYEVSPEEVQNFLDLMIQKDVHEIKELEKKINEVKKHSLDLTVHKMLLKEQSEPTKKGNFVLNDERWEKSGMETITKDMYDCVDCVKTNTPHKIIEIPGPPVRSKYMPLYKNKCTGCGAETGPWIKDSPSV